MVVIQEFEANVAQNCLLSDIMSCASEVKKKHTDPTEGVKKYISPTERYEIVLFHTGSINWSTEFIPTLENYVRCGTITNTK